MPSIISRSTFVMSRILAGILPDELPNVEVREIGSAIDEQSHVVGPALEVTNASGPVDVPLDEVSVETSVSAKGPFEVDPRADGQIPQGRPVQGLAHGIAAKSITIESGHGQAAAIHRNRVAHPELGGDRRGLDFEGRGFLVRLDSGDGPHDLDDAGKHDAASAPAVHHFENRRSICRSISSRTDS